ncbi:hypothetical protein GE09DRAFT_71119 [Coniochaeta sp. 2T2.1]|nr:hypothetical protein GE09DRAFT_71119 [Coniochaeta sp. 2T2.1]
MSAPQVSVVVGESQQALAHFGQIWEMLAIQIHNLNEAKVVAMTGALYNALDHAGRRYMQDRMRMITDAEATFFVRDGMHPDRWLLGSYDDLQSVPGSAIYILNGVPTLSLNGPNCPYPIPAAQPHPNQAIVDMSMAMPQVDLASSPETVSDSQTDGAAHVSSTSNAQDTDVEVNVTKITRPPNAYILYRKDKRHPIERKYPGIRNNEISVLTGSMWNTESPQVRAEYAAKADALKAEHKRMYPDYKYTPRRPEQVKRRAKRNGGKATKQSQGKITKTRKVVIGDMGKDHMRMLNEEAVIVGDPTTPASAITTANHTINIGVFPSTELETQCDIDEWNSAIPENNGFVFNSLIDSSMSDFLYTEQFDSGNDGDLEQSGY